MNKNLQSILKDLLPWHTYIMPVNGTPNSFFKALFIGTCLRAALRRMSHSNTVPDGLKTQECERNVGHSKPPIPYIPEKDVIQKVLDGSANTRKLTLPHKVELCVPGWSKGTPMQLMVHIQHALNAIRQKGHITAYEKACKEHHRVESISYKEYCRQLITLYCFALLFLRM